MATTKSGFTIVELLIVIVVIAILAAISIVAYNGIQQRAKTSSIVQAFKQTEKSLRLFVTERGDTTWPNDNTLIAGVANPSLSQLITSTSFKNYMQSAPVPNGTSGVWLYDYDLDTYNGCTSSTTGVNIGLQSFTDQILAQAVDDALDDKNLSCGKIRWDGSQLILSLSADGAV